MKRGGYTHHAHLLNRPGKNAYRAGLNHRSSEKTRQAHLSVDRVVEEVHMIYTVEIEAPAIDEVVTTEADNEEQTKERAIYSALQRQFQNATVTVEEQ